MFREKSLAVSSKMFCTVCTMSERCTIASNSVQIKIVGHAARIIGALIQRATYACVSLNEDSNLTPDWEIQIATEGEERREDEPCSFSEKTPFAPFWRIKGLARKAHDVFKGHCLPREINPLKNA